MNELARSGGFSDKLTYNLINASGRALTSAAINGGDLQGALRAALLGGLVDTAHGQAASLISQATADYKNNPSNSVSLGRTSVTLIDTNST